MRLNVSHTDDAELQRFLEIIRPCILKIGKTKKGRDSPYFHTYILLKTVLPNGASKTQ